jgi:hypothetical protein
MQNHNQTGYTVYNNINKIKPICANEVKLRRVLFILERQSNGLAFAADMAADMLLLMIQTHILVLSNYHMLKPSRPQAI